MENKVYIEYLIDFYDKQYSGEINSETRPLSFEEITGGIGEPYFIGLVDLIEKIKHRK